MDEGIRYRQQGKYNRNIWGIGLIVSGASMLFLNNPIFLIPFGAFLVAEHIWNWGEFESLDFIGHEWPGLLLVLSGLFIKSNYNLSSIFGLIIFLVGILINTNFSKDTLSKELK